MFTRIVRTGRASTVSTPAIAAQWTMWVAPAASSRTASASRTTAWWSEKFGWSPRAVPDSASRWRLSSATTSLSSTRVRASVVAMKPAPPVMKMRFPCIGFTLVSDEEFLEQAWQLVLRRSPDEVGRAEGLERLRSGRISRASYLVELVADAPFARLRELDDGAALARLHRGERPRGLRAPAWVDERAIEIPWVLARACGARRGLDVGTVFA